MGKPCWAIIGGGNGGQSMAGHLGHLGFSVRLYDIVPQTLAAVRQKGGIDLDGVVEGFGRVELATDRMAEALDGADIVVVVTPATAHRAVAENCASFLTEQQAVFVHPGATGGALEFRKVLADRAPGKRLTVAEANSLIYACRSPAPGRASILGVKNELLVAAIPATETRNVLAILNTAFPQMRAGRNVLETSLGNPNAMMHPGPTLLNTSLIESGREWRYYWDGITPSVGDFVEALDRERLAVARAFGLSLPSIREWYRLAYGAAGKSLSEVVRNNGAYAEVKGQKSLRTRYLLEDIPTGLVPMAALGRAAGVDVARMETLIRMGGFLLDEDFAGSGRSLAALGLAGMSIDEIVRRVETG